MGAIYSRLSAVWSTIIENLQVYQIHNENQDNNLSHNIEAQYLDPFEDATSLSDNMEVMSREDKCDTNDGVDLPEEVWCHIFKFLPVSDKASISLVSRNMYSAVTTPSLWKHALISKDKLATKGVAPVLEMYRFTLLKNLDLSGLKLGIIDWSALFNHVIQGNPMALENLNLRFVSSLADFPGEMIGKAVSKLKKVHLGNQPLITGQLIAILNHSLESSTLDSLSLVAAYNLPKVDAELLGKALGRLMSVDLNASYITKPQCLELFRNSLQCKTLAFLSLAEVDLSDLDKNEGELMTLALSEIAEVDLFHTGTYRAYPSKLSFDMLKISSRMTCVDLQACNLSEVDSQVLGHVVSRLVKVDLFETDLSTEQTSAIFSTCRESQTLKHLSIGGNDLSKVNRSIMTQVAVKMKTLIIDDTRITKKQASKLLKGIRGSSLKELSIEGNDLSGVSLTSMSSLAGLRVVNLQKANLNKEQMSAILTFLVETEYPALVALFGNKLPKEKKLLVRAKMMDNILLHESDISIDMSMLRSSKVPLSWYL